MKFFISFFFVLGVYFSVYAQKGDYLYRYDTLQIEQEWKKHLTGKRDTSYLKVCIPNNDITPYYDLNYDSFEEIICDDGTIIQIISTPTIPWEILPFIEEKYGDTIYRNLGNNVLKSLQREYFNTHILKRVPDNSIYYPQTMTWEGISDDGLFWKLIRIDYICISYRNATLERKPFYDSILNEYKILKDSEVLGYHFLPLYKRAP